MGDCRSIVQQAIAACNGCPPASPAHPDFWLVDRVTGSRATLGGRVDVDLTGAPDKTLDGRVMHVRGVYLNATCVITAADASTGAILARSLRALWQSITLTDVTGHVYLPTIDGRDLLDDQYFRFGQRLQWPTTHAGDQVIAGNGNPIGPDITDDYGLAANVGAGTYTRSVSLYIPFTNPRFDPLAGLIPVSALKRADGGALSFNLRSTLAGSPTDLALTSIANGVGAAGFDVFLDLVPLDGIVDGGAWVFDSYTKQSATGRLRHEDKITEYAYLRFRAADDAFGGTNDATYGYEAQAGDVDTFTLMAAGAPTPMKGWDKRYALFRTMERFGSDPGSALARMNAANDLPITKAGAATVILAQELLPYRPAGFGPASGQIDYNFGSIGSLTSLRFMHRVKACTSVDRLEAIADACQCQVTAAMPVPARGPATKYSPVLMTVR